MGLDMFLYAKKKGFNENTIEIGYWRKHPDLHDYISTLYYRAGGTAEIFNNVKYKLNEEEIEDIIELSINRKLPKSLGGFFFGETIDSDNDSTISIFNIALDYTKKDYEIIYDSWW